MAVAAILTLAALLFWARLTLRPDMTADSRWVFGEHGNQLQRVDEVLAGRVVYRDFAIQYGPLPTYLAATFAAIGGNTIAVNQLYHLSLRLGALAIFYFLMRRAFRPGLSVVLALIGGLPTLFASTHIEYISCELLAMFAILALYTLPDRRGVARGLAIGAVLGLCQWIKFGGGFVAGAAILAMDLLWLARTQPDRNVVVRWCRGLAATLGGFLLLEALLVALVCLTCRQEVARDALWPMYMLDDYAAKSPADRWPRSNDLKEFVMFQWLPLSALVLGLSGLVVDWASRFRRNDAPAAAACDVGLIFYLIASAVYLKHTYLFQQYAWAVVPAGCLAVGRMSGLTRGLALLSWLPALAMALKITFLNAPFTGREPHRLPNGEHIYVDAPDQELLRYLEKVVERFRNERPGESVLIVGCGWYGLGFYHYFAPSPPVRNILFDKHMLQSYDHRELKDALDRVAALVIVRTPEAPNPIDAVFPADLAAEFHGRFAGREEHDGGDDKSLLILERIDGAANSASQSTDR